MSLKGIERRREYADVVRSVNRGGGDRYAHGPGLQLDAPHSSHPALPPRRQSDRALSSRPQLVGAAVRLSDGRGQNVAPGRPGWHRGVGAEPFGRGELVSGQRSEDGLGVSTRRAPAAHPLRPHHRLRLRARHLGGQPIAQHERPAAGVAAQDTLFHNQSGHRTHDTPQPTCSASRRTVQPTRELCARNAPAPRLPFACKNSCPSPPPASRLGWGACGRSHRRPGEPRRFV